MNEGAAHAEKNPPVNGRSLTLLGCSRAYRQVRACDGMNSPLGQRLYEDLAGTVIQKHSLETLRCYRSPFGQIPHKVGLPLIDDPTMASCGEKPESPLSESGAIIDIAQPGCGDNDLWYILDHYFYNTGDPDPLSCICFAKCYLGIMPLYFNPEEGWQN